MYLSKAFRASTQEIARNYIAIVSYHFKWRFEIREREKNLQIFLISSYVICVLEIEVLMRHDSIFKMFNLRKKHR